MNDKRRMNNTYGVANSIWRGITSLPATVMFLCGLSILYALMSAGCRLTYNFLETVSTLWVVALLLSANLLVLMYAAIKTKREITSSEVVGYALFGRVAVIVLHGSLMLSLSIYILSSYEIIGLSLFLILVVFLFLITTYILKQIVVNFYKSNFKNGLVWLSLLSFGIFINSSFLTRSHVVDRGRFFMFRTCYEHKMSERIKLVKKMEFDSDGPPGILWDSSGFAGQNYWTYLVYDSDDFIKNKIKTEGKNLFSVWDSKKCSLQIELNNGYVLVGCAD